MDIWPKGKRSEVMSKIRSKNTKPEMILRSNLFKAGFRFRLHEKDLPGKPDIVLPKYHTVIFVQGCFWHLHKGCQEGRIPLSNIDYWKKKLHKNVLKDKQNKIACEHLGWKVIIVWECQIEKHLDVTLSKIIKNIKR